MPLTPPAVFVVHFECSAPSHSISYILLALVFYEYLLTLEDERVLVWQRKWTGLTVLFVFNRTLVLFLAVEQVAPAANAIS